MAGIGAKVSRPGFDVRTCADHELLFSSSWPLLKIHSQGSFSIPDTTVQTTIATHGLGYVPMFWVFDNGNSISNTTSSASRMTFFLQGQYTAINSTNLIWRSTSAGSFSGYYYIFRYDMTTSFEAEIFNSTSSTKTDVGDYGIKVAKSGKSITSTDLRDYVVHSGSRSPMIHKTGTGSFGVGGGTATITHNLGYEPLYFVYAKYAGGYADSRYEQLTGLALTSADVTYASDTSITISVANQLDYFYMIFKDPMLIGNS